MNKILLACAGMSLVFLAGCASKPPALVESAYIGPIKKDGKSYASPRFDTEQEAKDWYLQKKAELHTFMRENNALSRR